MATADISPQIEPSKLDAFMGKAVVDMGAAFHAALVVIGDKLGLYKAMAGAGPMTSTELARRTNTTERYVREWLNANAAGGFVTYDSATKEYMLPPEQAFALTTLDLPGAFHIISACFKDEPKITQAFRNRATVQGTPPSKSADPTFPEADRFVSPVSVASLSLLARLGETLKQLS